MLGAVLTSLITAVVLTVWLDSAILLVLVLSCIPALSALGSVAAAELNAERRFLSATLAPAYGTLGGVAVLLTVQRSPLGLAASLTSFEAARWLALLMVHRNHRSRAHTKLQVAVTPRELRIRIWHSLGWQTAGASLISLNPLIDVLFARSLGEGAVSFVEYGGRLWNAVPLLFSGPLLLAYFRWSSDDSRRSFRISRAKRVALKAAGIGVVITPLACVVIPTLVAMLFGVGVMSTEDQQVLASLLVYYLVGTAPLAGGLFMSRAYSAAGKVHVLALAACAGLLLNLLGDWILPRYLGLNGIGLATALSYTASFLVMLAYGGKPTLD